MKNHILFWGTLILLAFLVCIIVLKNGWSKYVESMRVIPRPEIHAQQEYTPPPGALVTKNIGSDGLNEDVDRLIGQYFNKNKIPYTNTIAVYYKHFVNVGNLDPILKKKLRDICYYIIEIVIPNLPSVDNPKPKVKWTRIDWLADNWNAYNFSFNADALANFDLLASLRDKYGGKSGKSGKASGNSGSGDKGSRNKGSSSNTTTNNSLGANANKSGNGSSGCNSACPTACEGGGGWSSAESSKPSALADAAASATTSNWMNNKERGLGYRGKKGSLGTDGLPGTSASGTFLNDESNGDNILYQVLITDVPNKFPDSQQLNDYVKKEIIDKWFDTISDADRPLPSKYAESMFDLYTTGRSPIDRNHKNKLRDLVYYYMENIIPGLPTEDNPVSYVEWRPLRFLSNSDL